MISYNQIYTSIGIPGFAVKSRLGTSYFHLSLNMVNDGEYVLTLSKTAQKLHIFDVLRNEYIMTDCDKSWDYDIKPKKGRVDKEFFITVLDFINANLQSPEESVVERKPITESAWDDMRERGEGKIIRKEDDVNLMNFDDFYQYLQKKYESIDEKCPISGRLQFQNMDIAEIFTPIEKIGIFYKSLVFEYNKKTCEYVKIRSPKSLYEKYPNLERFLSANYTLEDIGKSIFIHPKNGKITNQTVIDLVNIFLVNSDNPLLKKNS
jgi:hypothetical protein